MRNKGDLTLRNIVDAKIPVFDFTGEWEDAFGKPQSNGIWYVYGNSGHGKTSFILMLIKQLSKFGKILFVSYEEGAGSVALQEGIKRLGLLNDNKRVVVSTEHVEELEKRLKTMRNRNIVIIDSLDLSGIKRTDQIISLKNKFKNKLFIYTGWARGKEPASRIGENVLYLANQKIIVEGYRAISRGRSSGERGYLTVWDKGATEYWEFK